MDLKRDLKLYSRDFGVPSTMFEDYNKHLDKTFDLSNINLDTKPSQTNQITPYIIEERDRRFTQIDILTYLVGQRIISINGAIDSEMVSILRAQFLYLEELDGESEIEAYIDTPGGSCHAGLSLYDTMCYVGNDIRTTNFGMCASMGSVLVTSGAKGKRGGLPNSTVMIHQLSGGYQGHYNGMKDNMKQSDIVNDRLFTILAKNCGKSKEQIIKDCGYEGYGDLWLWGNEAVEYGALDYIIPSRKKNKENNNLPFYES